MNPASTTFTSSVDAKQRAVGMVGLFVVRRKQPVVIWVRSWMVLVRHKGVLISPLPWGGFMGASHGDTKWIPVRGRARWV